MAKNGVTKTFNDSTGCWATNRFGIYNYKAGADSGLSVVLSL
jgi:hypothetical protein